MATIPRDPKKRWKDGLLIVSSWIDANDSAVTKEKPQAHPKCHLKSVNIVILPWRRAALRAPKYYFDPFNGTGVRGHSFSQPLMHQNQIGSFSWY